MAAIIATIMGCSMQASAPTRSTASQAGRHAIRIEVAQTGGSMIRSIALFVSFAAANVAAQPVLPVGMAFDLCKGLTTAVPDSVKAYFRTLAALPQSEALPVPLPE